MTTEEAMRELVKVSVGFKLLEKGVVSTMSDSDYQKFLKWLD